MSAVNEKGRPGGDDLSANQTTLQMNSTPCLNINQDAALQHVGLLTGSPTAQVTIVTIRPESRAGTAVPPETRHGTLALLWPWIERQQVAGFDVYITVNATDGVKRTKSDITRIRAVYLDDDTARDAVLSEWPIEPHMVVETSPGKYHYYWRVDEAPGLDFEDLLKGMAARYSTDKSVIDISRVLRLAGTVNLKPKAGGHVARIVQQSARPHYTKAEVFAAFPPDTITALPSFDEDPVAQRLVKLEMVKSTHRDGSLHIRCPFEAEHTGGVTGATSCIYYPPHTRGFVHSNFKCQHAHCAARAQRDFLTAIGLDPSLRRNHQKAENLRLQESEIDTLPSIMTVDEMLADCILIKEGGFVGLLSDPRQILSIQDFARAMAASKTEVPAEGNAKPRTVQNSAIWLQSPFRQEVMTQTFHAGAPAICFDPKGKTALNTWRRIERRPATVDIKPFLDHIEYLFGAAAPTFLDSLAHIEQRPGELPHFGWLHIAANTGTGRNLVASLLARVWCGQIAPNVDLPTLFDSAFNGVLSGSVLAVVDEAQEGGSDKFRNVNKLKSMMVAEIREINPKFGRQYLEHNACRWLVFSNHDDALPLNDTDRRWWVVRHVDAPRPPDYYAALYELLKNPEFINSFAVYLQERDISKFQPGQRPPLTADKRIALSASKSLVQGYAEDLIKTCPNDIATNRMIAAALSDGDPYPNFTAGMRRALENLKCVRIQPLKINGLSERCWILRNVAKWKGRPSSELAAEVIRPPFDMFA